MPLEEIIDTSRHEHETEAKIGLNICGMTMIYNKNVSLRINFFVTEKNKYFDRTSIPEKWPSAI